MNISLLFADDAIVFYKASEDQKLLLSWILFRFEVSLGMKINLDLIPMSDVQNREALAAELGCRIGSLPSLLIWDYPLVPCTNIWQLR